MRTELLEYFIAVAQEGNITSAAEVLHITQPTLSRQLADLEQSLGVQLLVRGKRRVTLTEAGALFLERAQEIVELTERTCEEVRRAPEEVRGTIHLGYPETAGVRSLSGVFKVFSERYPLITYDLYSGYSEDIRYRLDTGALDVGVVTLPADFTRYDHLDLADTERWGVLCSSTLPLAQLECVTPRDVYRYPLIVPRRAVMQDAVLGWLGDLRAQAHVFATYNLILSGAHTFITQELGIALCTEAAKASIQDSACAFVPLEPARYTHSALVWRHGRALSRPVALFIEEARSLLA